MTSKPPPGQQPRSGLAVGPAAAERLAGKPGSPHPTPLKVGAGGLDAKSMEKIIAVIATRDVGEAHTIMVMLNQAGVLNVTIQETLHALRTALETQSPDLLIVGADLDAEILGFVRDIRHNKSGNNPFMLITTLVDGDQIEAVKKAMQAGTDDIIIRPVKEDQLIQRLRRVTLNRQAFVVTSDYLGPDRRTKNRPSSIRRIQVLNTMLEKANGKDLQTEDVQAAVAGSMNDVLHARLDSNSYRLGFVCHIIMDAYHTNTITPDVKEKILVLVDVLRDAAKTAERVNEVELGMLCGSLAKDVEEIAERYQTPTDRDLKLIRKLTRAVMMAVKPHVPPAQLEKETREAAENYLKQQREQFAKGEEIRRSPADAPIDVIDEPVLEILPVAKGQVVFKQGDPATAAYILANGSIAIYREIGGKQVPITRIQKGEFFGEMAIIDGTPRRATAVALEDCTLSLIARSTIESKIAEADPTLAQVMHLFIDNVRAVSERFSPKPRNLHDIAADMKTQMGQIRRWLADSDSEPITTEAAAPMARLEQLTADICGLLEKGAALDPRHSARPPSVDSVSPPKDA